MFNKVTILGMLMFAIGVFYFILNDISDVEITFSDTLAMTLVIVGGGLNLFGRDSWTKRKNIRSFVKKEIIDITFVLSAAVLSISYLFSDFYNLILTLVATVLVLFSLICRIIRWKKRKREGSNN